MYLLNTNLEFNFQIRLGKSSEKELKGIESGNVKKGGTLSLKH